MAIRQTRISDLDGSEEANIGIVIRDYPGVEGGGKVLDITQEQSDALAAKAVKDVINVEVRLSDTSTSSVLVTKKDLDAWLGNPDVLKNAASVRGRRPGYSPGNGNGH